MKHSSLLPFIYSIVMTMALLSCRQEDRTLASQTSGHKQKGKKEQQELFAKGKKLGELKSKRLNEVSGLAASVANENMLWALNDSGNEAEVYLIDRETNIKRTYVLKGVKNRDWEEITVSRDPISGKNYVYVGDIGDNMAVYPYKYIYRFEEPEYRTDATGKVEITNFQTLTFSLSDQQRDTEAFVVDPKTGDLYIISKWKTPVDLYVIKAADMRADTAVARRVGTLPFSTVVAADFNRDGSELLIKTLGDVYYWKRDATTSVQSMLQEKGISLPYDREPQGESVAWSVSGDGYYTLSEQKKNQSIHLMFYQRQ